MVFVKLSVVSAASQSYCQLEASSTTQAALALVNFYHQKLFTYLCSVYYHSRVAFVSLRASDFAATIQGWDIGTGSRKVVRIGKFCRTIHLGLVDLTLIIYHFCMSLCI